MSNTDRMNWPYPSENQDPWWETFKTLMQAQDASGYAAREDRHLILFGGGTMTFTAGTGLLTWASEINILAAISGFKWYVAAGSISLNDGEVAYVDLSRYPTLNSSLAIAKAAQVPSTDSALALCVRIGNKVFFRNGRSINDGSSFALLEIETGGGGGGVVPLAKGDLITHDGATPVLAAVGAPGTVPMANPVAPNGWAWTAPTGGASPYPTPDPLEVPPYVRYISTAGNDANDGRTALTAWLSPSKARTWLRDMVDQQCVVIVLGDYTAQPEKRLNLTGLRVVRDGALLVCGELQVAAPPAAFVSGGVSPTDPAGKRTRITMVAPGTIPPNASQYLLRIDTMGPTSEYAVILDYDTVAGTWVDVSMPFTAPLVPGMLHFYDTTSNLEIDFHSCDGDAPPSPPKLNIGVMGLKTYTVTSEGNRINGCHGITLAGIFPYGGRWSFTDSSFCKVGSIDAGSVLITLANTYLLPAPLDASAGTRSYFGFTSEPSLWGAPTNFFNGCSSIYWQGVGYHRLGGGGSGAAANRGVMAQLCTFERLETVYDFFYVLSCIVHRDINLTGGSLFYYSGLYFHDQYGSNDYGLFGGPRAISATDSLILIAGGLRCGDPTTGSVQPTNIFNLSGSTIRFLGKYKFGPDGSDVYDCTHATFQLHGSRILGDRDNDSVVSFPATKGTVGYAQIMLDHGSSVEVGTLKQLASCTLNPMPIVRGIGAARVIVFSNGFGRLYAGASGVGADFGPDGAIVMIGGGYVEYDQVNGRNTNATGILLYLDKNARAFHRAIGGMPDAPSSVYLGGAGVISYPAATANDLAGPAASELCVLSR